ncbi:hypothetical protein AMJ40_07730 [candidate division TA06 bacterium DG_26]|uniref:Peptide deformylase n=1 Tax=candidate division TA06 bacterium DG_26 TaxID=1703771 RepID=A0A0S7WDQ5_UNCT6|nr:MAG: hypothetical protein AMJ40_07730 [candidate division TA06 bacterium DG_26]
MSVLTIRLYPDPTLRRKSKSVTETTDEIRQLADDMVHTLKWASGVGLAAPQIGKLLRVITLDLTFEDPSKMPICVINPEIVETTGSHTAEEGCLSIPSVCEALERPSSVVMRGLDMHGSHLEREFQGILARAVLHEIDHLDGILFIDRLDPLRKSLLKGTLKQLRQESDSQRCQLL